MLASNVNNAGSITARLEEVENPAEKTGFCQRQVHFHPSNLPVFFSINDYHSMNPPFIYWRLRFLKNHKRVGGQDFLVQMEGVIHIWGNCL